GFFNFRTAVEQSLVTKKTNCVKVFSAVIWRVIKARRHAILIAVNNFYLPDPASSDGFVCQQFRHAERNGTYWPELLCALRWRCRCYAAGRARDHQRRRLHGSCPTRFLSSISG